MIQQCPGDRSVVFWGIQSLFIFMIKQCHGDKIIVFWKNQSLSHVDSKSYDAVHATWFVLPPQCLILPVSEENKRCKTGRKKVTVERFLCEYWTQQSTHFRQICFPQRQSFKTNHKSEPSFHCVDIDEMVHRAIYSSAYEHIHTNQGHTQIQS